ATLSNISSTTVNLSDTLALLDNKLTALETRTLSLETLFGSTTEGLVINNMVAINGGLKVNSIASVGDFLTLQNDTEFIGRPYLNADTAGFAVIKANAKVVEVSFDREYLGQPIVNANISF